MGGEGRGQEGEVELTIRPIHNSMNIPKDKTGRLNVFISISEVASDLKKDL